MKELYVLIDWQRDFANSDGALYVPNGISRSAVENFVSTGGNAGKSVGLFATYDTHYENVYSRTEEAKQFPIHCVKGTNGWCSELPDMWEAHHNHHIFKLEKNVFDMWEQPDLKITDNKLMFDMVDRDMFFYMLREHLGVDTIHIAGLAADFCVKWAIEGFVERRFNVVVHKDLTAHIETPIEEVVANMRNVTLI